ncbi:MAG: tRNA (adenosine(37)-N6)-threonylcarbamoyltransferase complex transferase subunit TsaD [Bacteroidetes bacterium]|nr:tRNA (adenosine(37)-N6)-threonylcarbamoyltransferase complex transferase subunit TsaD [Bacteroidota bacterium]
MTFTTEPILLAIESSCDDTSAAVLKGREVLSNVVQTQLIHENFGGVVPELASREHQQYIVAVVDKALAMANIEKKELDAIAYTRGPGLLGSLLVGASFAKSLALALDIPLIDVNHMQAHILAHFIHDPQKTQPNFPFLSLTVSGGHTQLVMVTDFFDLTLLGETLDDAVGECFDKSAKLLGFDYPGGPQIDKRAQVGNSSAFDFGLPKVDALNFSFSGLKTGISTVIQKGILSDPHFIEKNRNDLCASIQGAILKILENKLLKAVQQTGIKEIVLSGGVAANSGLRNRLKELSAIHQLTIHLPPFEYCTDNAAMIGVVGVLKYQNGLVTSDGVSADARYDLTNL